MDTIKNCKNYLEYICSVLYLQISAGRDNCKCIPERTKRGRFRCVKPVCDPKGCNDKIKCKNTTPTSLPTSVPANVPTNVQPSVSTSAPTLPPTCLPACKMAMYDQTYFRGKSVEITENVNDFITIKFDNSIASVKVEGNCCWTLFADKNHHGASNKLKIVEYQSATNIKKKKKKASSAKNFC